VIGFQLLSSPKYKAEEPRGRILEEYSDERIRLQPTEKMRMTRR
jgi:hypothetical protein